VWEVHRSPEGLSPFLRGATEMQLCVAPSRPSISRFYPRVNGQRGFSKGAPWPTQHVIAMVRLQRHDRH
jgi:hypothetical protein